MFEAVFLLSRTTQTPLLEDIVPSLAAAKCDEDDEDDVQRIDGTLVEEKRPRETPLLSFEAPAATTAPSLASIVTGEHPPKRKRSLPRDIFTEATTPTQPSSQKSLAKKAHKAALPKGSLNEIDDIFGDNFD